MLLLSVHPTYVDLIFAGTKRVELRRRKPRVHPRDRVAIYASSPVMSLIGVIRVAEVRVAAPAILWEDVKEIAGLKRESYCRYFENSSHAVGIMIAGTQRFRSPVPLCDLRKWWPGFHPPQQFRYLRSDDWN